jgi:hypothetical protein
LPSDLFQFSLVGHWVFGWFAYISELAAHRPIQLADFARRMSRDTPVTGNPNFSR